MGSSLHHRIYINNVTFTLPGNPNLIPNAI